MLALAGTTALLSAFLDNLTTILLVVPVTFLLADALDIDPIPLIVIEVIASNIGGTATLIGDPPNIIIAGATDLSFNELPRQPRADRRRHVRRRDRGCSTSSTAGGSRSRRRTARFVMDLDAARLDPRLPTSCGGPCRSWSLTILAFFAHQALHIEPATVALTGAAVGLLVTRVDLEQALSKIEWPTLFFFVALFVMVGALEETGAIDEVADARQGPDRRRPHGGAARDRSGSAAIGSAIVDNIPFTTAMIPVVERAPGRQRRRRLLVGALARRLLRRQRDDHRRRGERRRRRADRAGRQADRIRRFLRIGIPVTLVSIADRDRLRPRPLRRPDLRRTQMPDSIVKATAARVEPLGADELDRRRPPSAWSTRAFPALPAVEERRKLRRASSASASSWPPCSPATWASSAPPAMIRARSTRRSSAAECAGGADPQVPDHRPRHRRGRATPTRSSPSSSSTTACW